MRIDQGNRVEERRKKRLFIPAIYFILELIYMWLILTIIQANQNPLTWALWGQLIMGVFFLYALFKTIHVYRRQKEYPADENGVSLINKLMRR